MMQDWKTTTSGIAMIMTALGALLLAVSKGTLTSDVISTTFAAVIGGVGLIYAADRKPT
jgi:hypothetical protein